jgi:hypothetical protein
MTTSDRERQLLQARERVARAIEALKPKHRGGEMEEFRAAREAEIAAERALSLARGEPTCMPLDWQPSWDVGAPCPHVVSSGLRTLLVYLAKQPPSPDFGATARMIDPGVGEEEKLALVEFKRCYAHRFGGPNDAARRWYRSSNPRWPHRRRCHRNRLAATPASSASGLRGGLRHRAVAGTRPVRAGRVDGNGP